ncbi:MAG: hypothetical protein V3V08_05535 [Nannocystaceae bacterium]
MSDVVLTAIISLLSGFIGVIAGACLVIARREWSKIDADAKCEVAYAHGRNDFALQAAVIINEVVRVLERDRVQSILTSRVTRMVIQSFTIVEACRYRDRESEHEATEP